jgi:DEAD/DEAH box helicase domain-containing protein
MVPDGSQIDWNEWNTLALASLPQLDTPVQPLATILPSVGDIDTGDMDSILDGLKSQPFYVSQFLARKTFAKRAASFARLPVDLIPQQLIDGYRAWGGIELTESLYSHQALAIEAIAGKDARNIVLATSTSSGKSLAFNVPVIRALLEARQRNEAICAIYVFPTVRFRLAL